MISLLYIPRSVILQITQNEAQTSFSVVIDISAYYDVVALNIHKLCCICVPPTKAWYQIVGSDTQIECVGLTTSSS